MKNQRGLSLLEVLVVLSLISLAGVLLIQVFGPTFQAASRNAHRMELQQSAWLVVNRVSTDLEQASAGGWSILSQGGATVLSVHRVEGMTAQGTRAWEDKLQVYRWTSAQGMVQSLEWPPSPPDLGITVPLDRPLALDSSQLSQFANVSASFRTLAKDVEEFTVAPVQPPASQPLKIRIVLKKNEAGPREAQRFELEREVMTWN